MTAADFDRHIVQKALAAFLVALLALPVGGKQEPSSREAGAISVPASAKSEAVRTDIEQLVKGIGYSDKVADDFVQMVNAWKNQQGRPSLDTWKQKLDQARKEYKQAKISEAQLVGLEESVAKEVSQQIYSEIDYDLKFFELSDVIKHKRAQCLGYSQLAYIAGNFIGLSVQVINVREPMSRMPLTQSGHVANILTLSDGKTMMLDLVFNFVSEAFLIEEEFAKVGNYWELKDETNPLGIHRRIQILNRNGLVASICSNRGVANNTIGQDTQAISDFTKAIKFNSKFAEAYCNRGATYNKLGQNAQVILDLTKAIELDPKFIMAYYDRGNVYGSLGQLPQAISDFSKATKLNPKYAEAYYGRGFVYFKLSQFSEAISDYSKAIELNPRYAKAYSNRGVTYSKMGQISQAISDFSKAIEVDPTFVDAYYNRGHDYYDLARVSYLHAPDFRKCLHVKWLCTCNTMP